MKNVPMFGLPMSFTRSESPSPLALDLIRRSLPELRETVTPTTENFMVVDSQPDQPGAYVTIYQNRGDAQFDMETLMDDYEPPFMPYASRNSIKIMRCDFTHDGTAEEVRRIELVAFKWVA